MRRAIEFLVGSLVVYGAMAACSAGSGSAGRQARIEAAGGAGAATDPTPDASAAMPPDPAPPPSKSGTRLHVRTTVFTGADGSRLVTTVGWHDTMRDEDCGFTKLEDGKLHCAPTPASIFTSVFGSADCKSAPLRLLMLQPHTAAAGCFDAVPPAPAVVYASDACTYARTRYDVSSSRYTGDTYSVAPDGSCVKLSSYPTQYDLRQVSNPQPMPASLFVAGEQTID